MRFFNLQEKEFEQNARNNEILNVFLSKAGNRTITNGIDILSKPIKITLNDKKVTWEFYIKFFFNS